MIYLKYLNYVIRHKWYVGMACFRNGLYWRAIVHDLSKLLPSELIPYARFFYQAKKSCYSCTHKVFGSQCDLDYSGIGNGYYANKCEDYEQTGIKTGRDDTGYYKPTDTGDKEFDFAWLLHQKRNRHHWQWWILPEDEGGVKILEIPEKYLKEMLCDWIGAGKAQGFHSPKNDPLQETRKWWDSNNHKMQLHPNTRKILESWLA